MNDAKFEMLFLVRLRFEHTTYPQFRLVNLFARVAIKVKALIQ